MELFGGRTACFGRPWKGAEHIFENIQKQCVFPLVWVIWVSLGAPWDASGRSAGGSVASRWVPAQSLVFLRASSVLLESSSGALCMFWTFLESRRQRFSNKCKIIVFVWFCFGHTVPPGWIRPPWGPWGAFLVLVGPVRGPWAVLRGPQGSLGLLRGALCLFWTPLEGCRAHF